MDHCVLLHKKPVSHTINSRVLIRDALAVNTQLLFMRVTKRKARAKL